MAVQADMVNIELEDLTIEAIKDRLRRHRRAVSGTKTQLIARLREDERWW